MTEEIQSLQNPRVKAWRALQKSRTQRMEQGLYLVEGEHMVQEALKEQAACALLIASDARARYAYLLDASGIDVFWLSGKVMESICDTKTPQGVAALCRLPETDATPGTSCVALDGVQDPGNVGTILRTMDAAGFDTLLIDEKTADPYSAKAMRASMGAIFRLKVIRVPDLAAALHRLSLEGCAVIAGDLQGEPFFSRQPFPEKVCLVIGNEGAGISENVKKAATRRLKLPMVGGAESLNAAVAGSIMIYDVLRERLLHNDQPQ